MLGEPAIQTAQLFPCKQYKKLKYLLQLTNKKDDYSYTFLSKSMRVVN